MGVSAEQAEAKALAASMRSELARLLALWFPRRVDARGGFHQHFARDWSPLPGDDRSLVFQARMTWVAAVTGDAAHAEHGLAMLARMQAASPGAYHWETDPEGQATGRFADQVHAYGEAFAIFAFAAAGERLNSASALAEARMAFEWLEEHHRARWSGGWREAVTSSGRPIRVLPWRRETDAIGTPYGRKSSNGHLHLLEAFLALHRLWPDQSLRARIEELARFFTTRFWAPPGRIHATLDSWLRPVPGPFSAGHALELAHLLLEAGAALGEPDAFHVPARALLETALAENSGQQGGFFEPAPNRAALWWVQAEALLALAALWEIDREPRTLGLLRRQWEWIANRQRDPVHGGWFESVGPDGSLLAPPVKGHGWKEIYHETRCLAGAAAKLESAWAEGGSPA